MDRLLELELSSETGEQTHFAVHVQIFSVIYGSLFAVSTNALDPDLLMLFCMLCFIPSIEHQWRHRSSHFL